VSEGVDAHDLVRWAEALAGVARTGLGFTQSLYEQERFEEVLKIAADILAASAVEREAEVVEASLLFDQWMASVGSGVPGYVTPKSAVGAVVGDEEGRLLLVQRKDSGWWLYPTGWADVGYSPAEVALKEVKEETGIDCRVDRLFGVIDPFRMRMGQVPLYLTLFLCHKTGGTLAAHPLETGDLGFFGADDLPSPLAIRPDWLDTAFRAIAGEDFEPLYDPPRDDVWRQG
jgi:8-oxo-dGTP pyrophosphatase MutT (NUDIX family)